MVIDKSNMPYCPDKLLFAEDLVSYVLTKLFDHPYEGNWASEYREHIFNVFNDDLKVATWDIVNRILDTDFEFFRELESMKYDPIEFSDFSTSLRDCYRGLALEVPLFLLYSVEIAIIAAIFAKRGHERAPDMATAIIIGYFDDDNDMLYGRWKVLHEVAKALSSRFPNKHALARLGVISPPRGRQSRQNRLVSYSDEFDLYGIDTDDYITSSSNSDLSSISEDSPDPSMQDELLQPFEGSGGDGEEYSEEISDELKMHETDTRDTFIDDKCLEVGELAISAVSVKDKASQAVTSFEGVLQSVRGLSRNTEYASNMHTNSLRKEYRNNCAVRNLFGKCKIAATKENYYRLSDVVRSPGSSSESTSRKNKASNTRRNRCSNFKITRIRSDSDSSPDIDRCSKRQKQ